MRIKPTLTFTIYEIKRAIARKKVIAILVPIVLLDTVPFYILSTTTLPFFTAAVLPFVWIVGVLAPFSIFIQFIAILIAAGAMSEEYEQGTAELLLSKPVSRTEYFAGKFLGGYLLLFLTILLSAILSVAAASLTFGSQSDLDVLPGILLSEAYAAALFYSFAFMAGELVRRSSLSYIFVSAVFFSSQIIGFYTSFVYQLTGREFYRTIYLYLPTSPVNSLPLQYATGHLPTQTQALFQFFNGTGLLEPTIELSVLLLGGYIIVAVGVALAYFRFADVSRRVS